MVKNSKQIWQVGNQVKVGFLTLIVKAAITTPGDGLPDAYFLTNQSGDKLYEFVPHRGLRAVELDEVVARVAEFRVRCERIAAEEISKAAKASLISRQFDALFGQAA